ncbi:hypothetical protein [Marinobacter subterrani]|uniref:Mu-like prophage FluMu N-terminal domain-containing protein n=1 Tax=Marinobacter subterrani TaxID=1658765 RepID=A0A0J7JBY8_9GAMM|nr:hypothetical protein [Marinobacter subterrani]KMQ75331.1 hypothetical protein Msub_11533 [Marinobacter subterrani]
MAARKSTAKTKAAASTKAAEPNTQPGQGAKETEATEPAKDQAAKEGTTDNAQAPQAPESASATGEAGQHVAEPAGDAKPEDAQGDNTQETGNQNDQGEQTPDPEGDNDNPPEGEKAALWVRTRRRVGSRRRAGIRFGREPIGVDLESLTDEQVKAIKEDPALIVEDVTYPAESEE